MFIFCMLKVIKEEINLYVKKKMVEGFKINQYFFIYDEINVNYIINEVIYNIIFCLIRIKFYINY